MPKYLNRKVCEICYFKKVAEFIEAGKRIGLDDKRLTDSQAPHTRKVMGWLTTGPLTQCPIDLANDRLALPPGLPSDCKYRAEHIVGFTDD